MKILFLTSRFPWPPDRGDRLTLFNLMRAFSESHEVTLLSFADGSETPEGFEAIRRVCRRVETVRLPPLLSWLQAWVGLVLPQPSQVSYYRSGRMQRLVRRIVEEVRPDAVLPHAIRMAPYGAQPEIPVRVMWLADSLGLALGRSLPFSPWWKRPGIAWERRRVDRYSARLSPLYTETWAISPADLEDMRRIGCVNLALVTHGVDERLYGVSHRPAPEPRVVFLGNLAVPHNIDGAIFAARSVWPRVRAAFPTAKLQLVGASPAAAVRELASLPGVEVTGLVPDLLDVWTSADVLLASLRFSTGIQNKVIEAMAAGVPVVTTPQVAAGVEARDPEHLRAAEGAEALADAVIETLRDPASAAARVPRAREHVRSRFSWQAVVGRFEHLLAEARRS